MKYYSEMTDKVYDSVDELNADEKRIHEEELEFQRREQEKKAKVEAEKAERAQKLEEKRAKKLAEIEAKKNLLEE